MSEGRKGEKGDFVCVLIFIGYYSTYCTTYICQVKSIENVGRAAKGPRAGEPCAKKRGVYCNWRVAGFGLWVGV